MYLKDCNNIQDYKVVLKRVIDNIPSLLQDHLESHCENRLPLAWGPEGTITFADPSPSNIARELKKTLLTKTYMDAIRRHACSKAIEIWDNDTKIEEPPPVEGANPDEVLSSLLVWATKWSKSEAVKEHTKKKQKKKSRKKATKAKVKKKETQLSTEPTSVEKEIKPIDASQSEWWNCKNLWRLREIDSNPKREGTPGTSTLLKHMKTYLTDGHKRSDIAGTLSMNEEKDRIVTSMQYKTMFLQK